MTSFRPFCASKVFSDKTLTQVLFRFSSQFLYLDFSHLVSTGLPRPDNVTINFRIHVVKRRCSVFYHEVDSLLSTPSETWQKSNVRIRAKKSMGSFIQNHPLVYLSACLLVCLSVCLWKFRTLATHLGVSYFTWTVTVYWWLMVTKYIEGTRVFKLLGEDFLRYILHIKELKTLSNNIFSKGELLLFVSVVSQCLMYIRLFLVVTCLKCSQQKESRRR